MGMVYQHQVLIGQGIVDPLLRRAAWQEVVNLLQGFVHVSVQGLKNGTREYSALNRPLRPLSILTL